MKTRILENKAAAKWIGVILIVFFCAIGVKSYYSRSSVVYPIAADAQDVWVEAGETVKVKIRPDCWSGWVNIPPSAKFAIDGSGEAKLLFWDREYISIKDGDPPLWLGDNISQCSFRILGTVGEVAVTVKAK